MEREPVSKPKLLIRRDRTYQRWRMKQAWRERVIGNGKKETNNSDDSITIGEMDIIDTALNPTNRQDNPNLELLGELEG